MLFTDPIYLILLVPAGALLAISYRRVHGMIAGRKRLAFALRALVLLTLILALAGPEARRSNRGMAVAFLVDRSESISDADRAKQQAFVQAAISRLGPEDVANIVVFGGEPRLEAATTGARTLPPFRSLVSGTATDIAAAIRLASALFPDGKGKRMVLLTDGNETTGDAAGAADVAGTEGIPIDVVRMGSDTSRPEASMVALQAPSEAAVDRPFEVRLVCDSSDDQTARVTVDRDGVPFKTLSVHLNQGKTSVVVPDTLHAAGFHRYRATLESPKDTDPRNNLGLGFVYVRGKPKTLVLQEKPSESTLVAALRRSGADVEVLGPSTLPTRADELQGYDSIIFNDINALHFLPQQMDMIRSAVRDSGIGMAMVGGENSFLPGGYYGSPIADALPVDLNIKQHESYAAASICIICDVSGSMGLLEDGIPKVRIVAKAAEETVKMLSERDRIAVAGSASGVEWVAPMQPATNKAAIIDQIERLQLGGGGIYAYLSAKEGQKILEAEHTKIRHFILMCDGDDTEAQEGVLPIIAQLRAEKITTSTVAIGAGKDLEFLKQVAALGGGRYYLADHANKLPAIMTQDASIVSRTAIEEGVFLPKLVDGEEILRGLPSTPALLAYDLTEARPLARTGMRTGKDDPLLATWPYGLATTLAFTSDAQPKWAARWVPWSGFSTFWGQALQAITRRATSNQYQVSMSQNSGKGTIEVKATDRLGNPLNAQTLPVQLASPSGQSVGMTLTKDAPGQYQATFDASELGSYIVSVVEHSGGKARVETAGFSIPYPVELQSYRTNEPLLQRVASATGGHELTQPTDALKPVKNPGESITELWPTLVALGMGFLLLDIAIRRLAIPFAAIMNGLTRMLVAIPKLLRGRRQSAAAPAHLEAPMARLTEVRQEGSRRRRQAGQARDEAEPSTPIGGIPPREGAPPVPAGDQPRVATPPGGQDDAQPTGPPPLDLDRSVSDRLLAAKRRRRGED